MILDSMLEYSLAQAVTAVGDTPSTNVYDFGSAADMGVGDDDQFLVVKTVAAGVSGGGGTMQIVLQDSADNSSWADVQTLTPALAAAALTANKTLVRARLPLGLRRYTRVAYRIVTAVYTAGSFSAFIVDAAQAQQYGASGFTVA